MKLRTKLILFSIISALTLVIVFYYSASFLLMRNIYITEDMDVRSKLSFIQDILTIEISDFNNKASDWSNWDDTYQFIRDRNTNFIKSNCNDESLNSINVDLMVFLDENHQVVYQKILHSDIAFQEVILNELKTRWLLPGSPLFSNDTSLIIKGGIVPFNEKRYILIARPILNSNGKGPSRGTLIWGREIDNSVEKRLMAFSQLELKLYAIPFVIKDKAEEDAVKDGVHIEQINRARIIGYKRINDLTGKPSMFLKVNIPRTIYQQGVFSVNLAIFAMLLVTTVILLVVMVMTRRIILTRLDQLGKDIHIISDKGDFSGRVRLTGVDEFGVLGDSINKMMENLQQAQAGILESENRYRAVVEQSSDAIVLVDPVTLKFIDVNDSFENLSGYNREESLGLTITEFVKESFAFIEERFKYIREKGHVNIGERKYYRKNGLAVDVEVNGYTIVYKGKTVVCFMVRDITERIRANESLRESEETSRAMINAMNDRAMLLDFAGTIKALNEKAASMIGRKAPELIGLSIYDMVPMELGRKFRGRILRVVQTRDPYRFEEERDERIYDVIIYPISDIKGTVSRVAYYERDITEIRMAAEELKRVHLIYQQAIENAQGIPYRFLYKDQVYEFLGGGGERLFETDKNSFTYEYLTQMLQEMVLVGSQEYKDTTSYFQAFLERKLNNYRVDLKIITPSGKTKWISDSCIPLVDNLTQEFIGTIGIFQDITYRKEVELALQESEKKYRNVVNNLNEVLFQTDLNGCWTFMNPAWTEITGFTLEETLRHPCTDFLHADDCDAQHKGCLQLFDGILDTFQNEFRFRTRQGEYRWMEVRARKALDEQGNSIGITGSLIDIHEKRKAQEAVAEREKYLMSLYRLQKMLLITTQEDEFYQLIVESLGKVSEASRVYVFLNHTDKDGQILTSQRAEWCVPGITPQIDNPNLQNLAYSDGFNRWFSILSKGQVLSGKVADFPSPEQEILRPQNIESVLIIPLMIEDQFYGFLGFDNCLSDRVWYPHEEALLSAAAGDICLTIERRLRADKLQHALDDLKRSNQELELFAYVASHDLQEPLRMITSYVQLLARRYQGKLDKDADEFIHYAVDGAIRMQGLINDLLSYSRVGTRGKLFNPVEMELILQRTLTNLQVAIEESGAVITHDALPVVMGDDVQLGQLFQNLITNAIKFRVPEVKPVIHIGVRQEEHQWVISIRDNGIGIPEEHFDKIFIIFKRLHTREQYAGTGLGLAICKRIVQRHNGQIWVESSEGSGSTFIFTIPVLE